MFVLSGVLHIWAACEGIHQFVAGSTRSRWEMLLCGSNAPRAAFQHTTDALTADAQSR